MRLRPILRTTRSPVASVRIARVVTAAAARRATAVANPVTPSAAVADGAVVTAPAYVATLPPPVVFMRGGR